MPLASDLIIDDSKFDMSQISSSTAALNDRLIETQLSIPKWYEVGAEKFRQMRWNGETSLPKPVVISSGVDFQIPSRDAGREIPCRMFKPENGQVKGVFMHIHGGGFVLQSEKHQDTFLKWFADNCQLAVVSVGYRLAPEHTYPAGPHDCFDAAEWLVKKSKFNYGADLMFIGGESAGAYLSLVTALHLLKTLSNFSLRGLLLHFGAYDLSMLPQARNFKRRGPLVLDQDIMERFTDAFIPNTTKEERRDPEISPFYVDFYQFGRGSLPPALFTCGTEDPLLDDTLMMAVKWRCSGSEAITKIFNGAPHGFILFPSSDCEDAGPAREVTQQFILEKLA
ncbi:putative alpha beta hydrolase fold-3 domain-containing protein [Botryosphaeria dothidea]|uniref:Alpha beta hydrolase fold-3 domain-containing protein n=1 Tax=Botryosphaeria dothidea TaxID=55169 RepID=A0A8H4N1T3_9PEZI|nr:putative alpha beta hydrolase fold-3 domain-containing protein [Botryosphaeria dothidea]